MNEVMQEQGYTAAECSSEECAAEVGAMLGVEGADPAKDTGEHRELLPQLKELHNLYRTLRKARDQRGAIDFETVETRVVFDDERVQRVRFLRRELVQRAVLVEKNRKSRRGDAKVEKWSARRRFECSLDERDVDEGLRESGEDEGWNEEDFEGTRFHNNAGRIFYDSIETRVAQKIGGISHGFSGDRERVSRYKL